MARLEELTPGTSVKGILPEVHVSVIDAKWHGSDVVELTYKDPAGRLGNELLYRFREPTLSVVSAGSRPWSFNGDGSLLKLVSEAYRIRLAYLFDPLVAVHTSLVEPLPHQITAVYGEMLGRQPLRYLLADDPGAGKTIMTGLLIKELLIRGDLQRCMIVCPGNLAEQWQDELSNRFHLPFEILTNDKLESARTGNWFLENPLAICRLDKLSRDEDLHPKLEQADWDLIVVDEAHKMSASFYGGEIVPTKRHKLGQLLSKLTRHFLLLTATPHNGKEEDFQLFLSLLDGDRFEGKFRDGVHTMDVTDLMRRMVKEQLVKFDGTPLFPERLAYTVNYQLSDQEAALYEQVTDYVRSEFNRAESLTNGGRKGTVGFALTVLQRRLASSPEAIYQSLRRRADRLERRLREERLLHRGAAVQLSEAPATIELTDDDIDDIEENPDAEAEHQEDEVADQATAAQTLIELEEEIRTLRRLEQLALAVRRSGNDRKWAQLSELLQGEGEMFEADGRRRKLVIFTEHRDTLNYLQERIAGMLGQPEAVVAIHGGLLREDRKKAQEAFAQDPETLILIATDAAGEGINLQRSHLMVNYDLPWNPNRLEQRFGRIHRIGQEDVCHLWNLVASETREGDVYHLLLDKLQAERQALGGAVYDVLGRVFQGARLRDLLIEAVRYGDKPETRARLTQIVNHCFNREHLKTLIEDKALAHDVMDATKLQRIRADMERAAARRLQPHFVESFFKAAFQLLGGTIRERENRRYELTHVPAPLRTRDRLIGRGEPILNRYERITFEKSLIPGNTPAKFVCPGEPLLDAVTDIMLERYRNLLKQGAVLIDPNDFGDSPRVLFYLEHSIQDARIDRAGNRRTVSQQMQFVELFRDGQVRTAGYAPYLDYEPATEDELKALSELMDEAWLRDDLESKAVSYAAQSIVPGHFEEVRKRKEELIEKTKEQVRDRLTKEIRYWDHRAEELKLQEQAGRQPRMNWQKARQRADDLQARLNRRMEELEQERQLSPRPPVALGGALIIPITMVAELRNLSPKEIAERRDTKRVELAAMKAVMEAEKALGFEPSDVSDEKRGYDIESAIPNTGHLRFIEVKGRVTGATTVTVTKNEILTALNKPDQFILALVEVDGDRSTPRYVRGAFQREPDFGATSVNYELSKLLALATEPA
jgi:superfamily II DNA or RNA helicase